LTSQLVFREVPGQSVQWRRGAEGFGGLILIALDDAVGGCIAGVAGAPTGLRLLTPGFLAIRLLAGALAVADAVVWTEPSPTDPARSLPGIGHARPSSSKSVVNFWRAEVGQSSRAPKFENCALMSM
jgi:hypothetical protein